MKTYKLFYKISKCNRKSFSGETKTTFSTRLAYGRPVRKKEYLSVCKKISNVKCREAKEILEIAGEALYNCLIFCAQVDVPGFGRFRLASRGHEVQDVSHAGTESIDRIVVEFYPTKELKDRTEKSCFKFEEGDPREKTMPME